MLILTAACFAAMAGGVLLAGAHPADAAARDSLLRLNSPVVTAIMRVITVLGHAWVLVPATALLLVVFPEARARWWVWIGMMLMAPIAETTFKFLIGRPRPFDASFGFPSGHATAAAVAISRVMLRAHWPSDVIGGVALGLALASAAALLARPARPAAA
jgi:membrane-associated phospholipid phosphatase